jgi:hypothetical protein
MQDNQSLEQIHEPTILKKVGIKRSFIPQQMTIIFIMNSKLEKKLLLLRAKNYAAVVDGIRDMTISFLERDECIWHREKLAQINSYHGLPKLKSYTLPVNESDLISDISSLLITNKINDCFVFFENNVKIEFHVIDHFLFIKSFLSINKTFDLSLAFFQPDGVLVVSDDEYELKTFFIIK